jgi:hypothetical protein
VRRILYGEYLAFFGGKKWNLRLKI